MTNKGFEIFITVALLIVFGILLSFSIGNFTTDTNSNSMINNIQDNILLPIKQATTQQLTYCPVTSGSDTDSDGILDVCDNCPTYYNPYQLDSDHDGFGDVCKHLAKSNDNDKDRGDEKIPECRDGIDNDGDGYIDYPEDIECDNSNSDSEKPFNPPQCRDGIDNDGDGFIDYPDDRGCESSNDRFEDPFNIPQCRDGLDNDGDGFIDFPEDEQCVNSNDDDESR